MKENGKADKQRVAERKTKLGKKGLKELAKRVENAIEENDVSFLSNSFHDDELYLFF